MSNHKEHFLAEVLKHIKSKEAKELVYKELNYHIKMSSSELVTKGVKDREAEEKAIKQMGSPIELGTHFNKLYRPLFDWKLFGLFFVIILMGILPIIHMQEQYSENLLFKQLIYIVLGIMVSISIMLIDYRKIRKIGWLFLLVAFGLLIALNLFPNVVINGVGYLRIIGFNINGTSLLPLFLVFWAFYLSKEKPRLVIILSIYVLSVFLLIRLSSISEVLIYSILVVTLFIGSSFRKKTIYTTVGIALGLVSTWFCISLLTFRDYQIVRIYAFFYPQQYVQNGGDIYLAIKDLLSKGGWLGNQKLEKIVPDITTDLVFANITYFYGWILSGILIVLLALLLYRLFSLTVQVKDRFGRQLILGVCSLLSIQIIYNIGMTVGLLPIISISLPFISYGLIPTVLNSLLIGIVLSVYRRKNLVLNG